MFETKCCEKLKEVVKQEDCFIISLGNSFNPAKQRTVYAISDGGHGGSEPCKFCPFCGAEIVIEIKAEPMQIESTLNL